MFFQIRVPAKHTIRTAGGPFLKTEVHLIVSTFILHYKRNWYEDCLSRQSFFSVYQNFFSISLFHFWHLGLVWSENRTCRCDGVNGEIEDSNYSITYFYYYILYIIYNNRVSCLTICGNADVKSEKVKNSGKHSVFKMQDFCKNNC